MVVARCEGGPWREEPWLLELPACIWIESKWQSNSAASSKKVLPNAKSEPSFLESSAPAAHLFKTQKWYPYISPSPSWGTVDRSSKQWVFSDRVPARQIRSLPNGFIRCWPPCLRLCDQTNSLLWTGKGPLAFDHYEPKRAINITA